ncbi:MAG: MotA/TolQ/ExbB proton channel family protein [Nitrospinae bacterium]|nr:MotA/TolQ/ExbB proton channel family protein [Nitrospinota bacterium]
MATLLAFLSGMSLLLIAMSMGAGLENFIDFPAMMIVFGGTAAAIFISFPLKHVLKVAGVVVQVFKKDIEHPGWIIGMMVQFSIKARRQSLVSLEADAKKVDNRFVRLGLEMVIDGYQAALIRDVLETELDFLQIRHRKGEHLIKAAGKLSPAFGLIGTVIGLVQMLLSLAAASAGGGSTTAGLAKGMAVALMTTFYGALLSNLIFVPIAEKLKNRTDDEVLTSQIIIEGILMLQAGVNPRILEKKLNSFLPPDQRVAAYDEITRKQKATAA